MSIYDKASLVLIPSGTKTSKVYSQKPVNGDGDFTFSRSTAATRVNADGLIEKETQNLLVNSNTFNGSGWTPSNASVTSGQSGYDGSSDAWLLQASGTFAFVRQLGLSVNGVATASVYLKAGTTDWVNFRLSASANNQIYVNLSNGTFGTISASNLIDKSIEDIGSGWYRVSIVLNVTSLTGFYIYVADGDNTLTTTSGDSIYIQDAQIEQGMVARDVLTTTTTAVEGGITDNVPRLDYTDSSCPALLLEPQRSNQIIQSEYFGASTWLKRTSDATAAPVVTDNYALSPEGLQNAARVVITKPSGNSQYAVINENKIITKSAGDKFSASVYLKATDASQVGKVVDLYAYDGSYMTMVNHTLTADWERVEAIHTATTGTSNVEMVTIGKGRTNAGGTSLSDMATDFLVYGATFEAGSYATSYIPTYGSAVTRVYDKPTLNPSTLLGATEGSWYLNFADMSFDISGTSGPSVYIGYNQSNYIGITNRSLGNVTQVLFVKRESGGVANLHTITSQSGNDKFCFTWSGSSLKLFVNGVKVYDDNAFANFPSWIYFVLGNDSRTPQYNNKQTLLFPTQITDAEAITLTTI